ncbi:tannase/feruloyl esterase family alpha/beta hydrolase [Phenylobacterium sp.]|jgi:hypothetical protein|uniref:tannase/feruloyl esterase family alpha/beta hydrolase n=1 Tax=Phenylobacterium sp. TaxID=1871053 RepID=UPI0037833195
MIDLRDPVGRTVAALLLAFAASTPAAAQTAAAARAPQSNARPPMYDLPARPVVKPARSCESLLQLDLESLPGAPTEIVTAQVIAADRNGPERCEVHGYVAPTIQFKLRLPLDGYTGRFLQMGCGGNCGFITDTVTPICDNVMALSGAFAYVSTDAGHFGRGGSLWARDNPALLKDMAERGPYAVTVAAKAIVETFYGAAPAYSYFQGCSNGGREAMLMAQRHPDAFDGLIAGAPANYLTPAFMRMGWQQLRNLDAAGQQILTPPKAELLHKAVMAACDGLDGLKDGQIDNPRACRFDPARIQCKYARQTTAGQCLTPAQVGVARDIYRGPVDAKTGRHLTLGGLQYGSELQWGSLGRSLDAAQGMMRNIVYGSSKPPGLKLTDLTFDEALLRDVMTRPSGWIDMYDADLTRFRDSGGKLLVWEGAADPSPGPNQSPYYYQRVRDAMGGTAKVREFYRMFFLPGVYHCRGGYMPYEANFLGATVNWVERGVAPDMVVAAAPLSDGGRRTRPVYAYPVAARYKGAGDINDAASFTAVWPKADPDDRFAWAGEEIAAEVLNARRNAAAQVGSAP